MFAKFTDGCACYHGYAEKPQFYLVYSVNLFFSIAHASIKGIEDYFSQHQIDPYDDDHMKDTSRW